MDREFKMHVYPFQACFDPPTSKKSSNLAIICVFCQKAPDEVTPRCLKYQPLGANTLKCANFSRRSKCDKESALQARPDCWVDFIVMCEAFFKPIAFNSEETFSAPSSSTGEYLSELGSSVMNKAMDSRHLYNANHGWKNAIFSIQDL